ncbi:hypothetical protein [Polaribacter butkevichii]|uniref:Class IIb bacteriocin, lactobin A/cerein 7B family n=1 Tax=Polaribacter butkevichii TaxID=218490 RepID=A0A2P6CE04_9FLAO|nr:hypothetical protein [Polaribacter butkevichii]PQJ73134.1 hypothetical protein BTO14_07635 [Polaribacter butkevichii]
MKNLQSFGVQELSAKEIKETEGGFLGTLIVIGCCLLLAGCANGCEGERRRESDGPPPPPDGYQY